MNFICVAARFSRAFRNYIVSVVLAKLVYSWPVPVLVSWAPFGHGVLLWQLPLVMSFNGDYLLPNTHKAAAPAGRVAGSGGSHMSNGPAN